MNERTVKAIAAYGVMQDAAEAARLAKEAAERALRDVSAVYSKIIFEDMERARRELNDAVWCERHDVIDPELG